jgi:hypothetical protein
LAAGGDGSPGSKQLGGKAAYEPGAPGGAGSSAIWADLGRPLGASGADVGDGEVLEARRASGVVAGDHHV